MASVSAVATPEPKPWANQRKPWSIAALSMFTLVCGEPALSNAAK
jgi:hypothetical protein